MEERMERNHVAIEVGDQNKHLADRIMEEIPPMPSSLCFIYKVPNKFRIAGEDIYEPRVISIGPYHHGKEYLEASEKHKMWYLHSLLSRTATNTTLTDLVYTIREIEVSSRNYYAEPMILSSDEFVRMMILDGCFILELFYKYHAEETNMASEDSLFDKTWIVPSLRRDLVLLENQIPFIVLESLFTLTNNPTDLSLNELVIAFFDPILPTIPSISNIQNNPTPNSITQNNKHILDLLRNHLLPSSQAMEVGDYPFWEYTTCATDLRETGVKFKKKVKAHGLLDITFTDNGTFEIPPFCFGESWTVLFPNLIALEQCRRDYADKITSYVILLDSLINSHNDVKLLRDKGIIDGMFNEDEKVALAINNLCKGVVVDKFYYDGLCSRVNTYRKTDWHRWRATLKRDYFNTPWAVLSFIAAVVLLLLTATQTAFSIISYYKPK